MAFDLSDQSSMKIWVRISVRLKSFTILAFFTENNENEHFIFCTQTISSKIKLHILGVPTNKFGSRLIIFVLVVISSFCEEC